MNFNFVLLKILPYLKNDKISVKELSFKLNLDEKIILDALNMLIELGYLSKSADYIKAGYTSFIMSSILALKLGADLNEVYSIVDWRDFESFIEMTLLEYGYTTFKGFRLKKPRLEVDVLALKEYFGLVVDCKHWHKTISSSTLNSIVQRQIKRAKIILSKENCLLGKRFLVPVIVVLYPSPIKFLDGVPIVPVEMFKSFVGEIDGRLSEVLKVYLEGGKVYAKI
jgi:predicted transcriptional regulator